MLIAAPGCRQEESVGANGKTGTDGKPGTRGGEGTNAEGGQEGQSKARSILKGMVDAYKSAQGYADRGEVRVAFVQGGQESKQSFPYSVVMNRPNKIHLRAYDGEIASDGKDLIGFVHNVPNQVIRRAAPALLDVRSLFSDPILSDSIAGLTAQGPTPGFCYVPVPLLFLVCDDPLKTILFRSQEPRLAEPGKIDDHECQRIELPRPDGKAVLWIDGTLSILRRIEFPTDEVLKTAPPDQKLEKVSLSAEFLEARFEDHSPDMAFQSEIPAGVQVAEMLTPPPLLLLGKPAPEFAFVGLDRKPIDLKSFKGKIVVLDFWAKWCEPCRAKLPLDEKLYAKYKSNDKIAFLAVSVDRPDVADDKLAAVWKELGITIPIARDPQEDAGKKFLVTGIPTTCIVGGDGTIQDYQPGFKPNHELEMSGKLEKLLAGSTIHGELLKTLQEERAQYAVWLDGWLKKGLFLPPALLANSSADAQEIPKVAVAPRSDPKSLSLTSLWQYKEVNGPGNMVVVADQGGAAKIVVLDSWKNVLEIGPDGKIIGTPHVLDLPKDDVATLIRTALGPGGKRYYALSAIGQQQVHLFDDQWKRLVSFPEGTDQNPHKGIADVQLADLDGDGMLKIYVSYFGDVGVQCASLDGKRLWSSRSAGTALSNVSRIAVFGTSPQDQHGLLCTDDSGSLIALDPQGKRIGALTVPNRMVWWIVSADLGGPRKPNLAGLYLAEFGCSVAVGVGPKGEELWSYPLPKGEHQWPIERILTGNLFADGPGQWILPGVDGSIHILSVDGKPLDFFNYGEALTGLATMVIGGRPALVVSTPKLVEAWRVEKK